MSKKHIEQYYNKVCDQYEEFVNELKEFQESAKDKVLPPEVGENLKAMFAPLENNWKTLGYVMYLLNKSNKKPKQYERQHKKETKNFKTDKDVYDENKCCIKQVKDYADSFEDKK